MNKILYLLMFYIYFLFLDYITKMFLFDFRKYVLKDKYMKDLKFSHNWNEKYAEAKALEKFEQMQLSKNLEN